MLTLIGLLVNMLSFVVLASYTGLGLGEVTYF